MPLVLLMVSYSSAALAEPAQITRTFHRPPAASPLTHDEASVKVEAFAKQQEKLDPSQGRRLSSLPDEFVNAFFYDKADPVQQVNIAPGGPGEAVITWLSYERGVSNAVRYAPADGFMSMRAVGNTRVYSTQICLPNSAVMNSPIVGPPNEGFDFVELATLLNTSAILPRSSDSWTFVRPGENPFDLVSKTNYCIDYKNPLAYYTSPYIHTVVLEGLVGRTKYIVQPEGSNRTFTFMTPADPGEKHASPFRLGVWADVGITNISYSVMHEMRRLQPELLLTVGDLSYADGWSNRWDVFGTMMEPLLSSVYHLAVPGNHELTQNNGVDFEYRYPMPFRQSDALSSFEFAYEAGPVYVIGIEGSYATSGHKSPQWNFVADKLAQVDRARTPWVVVMFHTPWYNSNAVHYEEGLKHQHDMEELLYMHGVDIVFNGHIHSYERSFPVYKYARNDCGTTHIVMGDGGNYEGPAVYEGSGWTQPQPSWSAFREAAYGPGLLTVINETHAEWEWRRVACVVLNNRTQPDGNQAGKYSYGGTRQSLGRTRPLTQYVWDGISGPSDGPACATDNDDSSQRFEPSDKVTLVREVNRCPNKLVGSGASKVRTPGLIALASAVPRYSGFTARGLRVVNGASITLVTMVLVGLIGMKLSRRGHRFVFSRRLVACNDALLA
eukprot:TRINITY_DN25816_c0_g1_i1.p1 TRINITY_DN25816_c0_g1~~TRINITY_DN25816_c0_g1_i1.p1  ORF type:complete len:688 (+),score=43.79 TRINITY_DN25816_c0_g1_i1:64-2064(+)